MLLSDCHTSEDFLRLSKEDVVREGAEKVGRAHQGILQLEIDLEDIEKRRVNSCSTPIKSVEDIKLMSVGTCRRRMADIEEFLRK